ncbi:MAG: anti-sigma regulatory factor [Candidatus Acidiferrales bacterium]
MPEEIRISVASDTDIVGARQKGRALAGELGFSPTESTFVATAISELARNIVSYAKEGEILIHPVQNSDTKRKGIVIVARDEGPGIANPVRAMQGGYSTSGSLGLGLPGVRRLMDEFEMNSSPGKGTTVTVKKWLR